MSIVSTANSTTTPLGISATFTGTYEEVLNYHAISVVGVAGQAGTLFADFSTNGTTAIQSLQLSDGLSGAFGDHSLIPIARFFRIRVVNGAIAQGTMTVQTLYSYQARIAQPTSRMAQTVTNYQDALLCRSLLTGRNENDTTYNQVGITSQNNLKVAIRDPVTSYGELTSVNLEPQVQIDGIYGILTTDMNSYLSGTGAVAASNSLITVSSGTTVNSYAFLLSRNYLAYRPGQGVRLRITGQFTTGVASSLQMAGAFNPNNGFWFGYNGINFGLGRIIPGRQQITRLTITTGTGGAAENITVTLNSVAYVYTAVTAGLTAALLAEYLAENPPASMTPVWNSGDGTSPTNNGTIVTYIQTIPATAGGTYSITSTGTGTGTFTQLQVGSPNDYTTAFVPKTGWNLDVMDGTNTASNPSGINLNPARLNVFQIQIPFLGAGDILFSVMDDEGRFVYVHQIPYANNNTVPSQQNPTYRAGWEVISQGSTTNLTVSGASAALFNEGIFRTPIRYPFVFNNTAFAYTATETTVLTLRAGSTFASTANLRSIIPLYVSVGTATAARTLVLNVYLGGLPTASAAAWASFSAATSCAERSIVGATPAGGTLLLTFVQGTASGVVINLSNYNLNIPPGGTLVFSLIGGGGAGTANFSFAWAEL
jgi:hypothetical protein